MSLRHSSNLLWGRRPIKLSPSSMLPKAYLPYDLGHTLNCARRVLGTLLTPDVEAEIKKIVGETQRQLRRYGHAVRCNFRRRASRLEYKLSTSWGYRVISVLHSYPKYLSPVTFSDIKLIANQVCPRLPGGEKVVVFDLPKPEGGRRPIVKFGKISRANQSMARDMIYVACGHSPYEFARKGYGREKLIDKINNANKNGGVRALGIFDIKNCFPSMGISAAKSVIPLSRRIIQNTISYQMTQSSICKLT
jgi:hypothetical protein